MSGALHPRLAPLLAGGGAPERIAATSGELRGRIERLLSVTLPHLLDDDILAPLIAPPGPGDTLEAVLARLAGDVTEADVIPADRSMQAGSALSPPLSADIATHARASPPLPADIATHARAEARPAAHVASRREGLSPVVVSVPPVAVANASEPAVADRPIHSRPIVGRDWQEEAARLGADRPLSIASEPRALIASSADPGSAEFYTALLRTGAVLATGDTVAADQATAPSAPSTGSAALTADSWGPTPIAAARQRTASGPSAMPSTRRVRPIGGAAGAARDGLRGAARAESAARLPRLRAVALPEGARIGGFAGLAALGRAASRGPVPADPAQSPAPSPARSPAPSSAPARTSDAALPAAGGTSDDRPPPLEAKAVIAELADMLRLQVVAAGIDLSGRRS